MSGRKYTDEEKDLILKLYEEGKGSTTIARIVGNRTEGAIACFLSKHIKLRSSSEAARKYKVNQDYFEIIDTPEKAYWLGFIYADGYVSIGKYRNLTGIALAKKDKEHLEAFQKAISSNIPIHEYKTSSTNYGTSNYCRIQICSKKFTSDLIRHGVVEHKTDILKPPEIDERLKPHFIRGYFDGDGCLTYRIRDTRKEYVVKILSTPEFLDMIKNFIEDNNIATVRKYYQRKEGQTVRSLELGGNYQVRKFLDLIYKDSTIHLERKHERYIDLCNMLDSRAARKPAA